MPDPSCGPPDPASLAERVYFEAVFAAGGGRTLDFDALCRAHAGLAGELRLVHELWKQLKEPTRAPLGERLRERFGPEADPGVSLQGAAEATAEFSSAMIERLSGRRGTLTRYQLEGEIARGGMGAILRVWDGDLRRHLAMKVVLARDAGAASGELPQVPTSTLARFLEEAQVTGQLDHPGIVPVHELGLDAEGRIYFTMKLVKGRTLGEVFDELGRGAGGWTETRVLGLLLKACEAIGYAHDKGVIHRDLKPANVMVGKFGEVYVMDWGVAKILGREDARDVRVRPPPVGRGEERPVGAPPRAGESLSAQAHDSPLLTVEGEILGTPAYMSPEQARGQMSEMGPPSDVYSVGAMLYHLLAGHMPYVPPGVAANSYSVWRAVQDGPPAPLHEVAPSAPAELVAICERAMAREKSARYATTSELADDLAAYIEGRVVRAHEVGAWAEARKWIQRNRALAAALAGGVLLLAAGLSVSLVFKARADESAALAAQRADETAEQAEIALANADRAREQERLATQRADDVLSLSVIQDLEELVERADTLWPAHPENLPRYVEWLAEAGALIEGRAADPTRGSKGRPSLEQHKAKLTEIRGRARPAAGGPGAYEFDDPEVRWWHAQLAELVADLEAFCDPDRGGLFSAGTSEAYGWGIVRRAEFARTIGERSVAGPEARRLWEAAAAAIARSPYYGGLALPPQMGLLPIGADPESGLWEFAELQTGEPAVRGADGKLVLTEGSGLVLVLLPGATFQMGAQRTDPLGANYDPATEDDESPVHAVALSPFFLSKYEMTQGQWQSFTGSNPSYDVPSSGQPLLHPVEDVSWTRCMQTCARLGLSLPSEAQWEYAARGGTSSSWWTGDERESLIGAANLADQTAARAGASWPHLDDWPELDDGFARHAPVDCFAPNPFGLHNVHGNVWEWCLDAYDGGFYGRAATRDPACMPAGSPDRIDRGGAFNYSAPFARSAYRSYSTAGNTGHDLGLRPARAIMP